MLSPRPRRTIALALTILALVVCCASRSRAQAALLLEEPYGFFGTMNPTGHIAIYFAQICAETPVQVRRCEPGEQGTVISRYQGIAGFDWIAMPLIPYLYSVEDISQVPPTVDKLIVRRLRNRYHEEHLAYLGKVSEGNFFHGGWTQLVGITFERRTYAFRFVTTPEQDDAVIALLNSHTNRSDFSLLTNNCGDFVRTVLNLYFPRAFRRSLLPDLGMTTPKQITFKLTGYSRKHPEIHLTVFEIPQIRGYRRMSRSNKSISASLMTTGYAVPIVLVNPYLAGAIFFDYMTHGRLPSVPPHSPVLRPEELATLQFSDGGVIRAAGPPAPEHHATAAIDVDAAPAKALTNAAMKEIVPEHE